MIRPIAHLNFEPLPFHAYRVSQSWHYETPRELFSLMVCAWSLEQQRPVIVNIGAGSGTSGLAFAEARPDATVYTVDISPSSPFGGLENERNAFKETGLKLPLQILGDSKQVGKSWVRGPVNLVFVDGDHSLAGCQGDIEAWREHILPGGLILLHDYTRAEWPDVWAVVHETDALACFDPLFVVDTLWVGRKRA